MWFVRAKRNKKVVNIPAYNGQDEALAIERHLIRYGWVTKVVDMGKVAAE